MIDLRKVLDDYLKVRRALGFKLERESMLLPNFVQYLEDQGSSFVTIDLSLKWARQPSMADPNWHGKRLVFVRGFAKYLSAIDPRHEIPSADLIPSKSRRRKPYLYSDAEIRSLMVNCKWLSGRLKPLTYSTYFGLLAVTGMRTGEAVRLDREDVNLKDAVLVVRYSKFNRSREVPIHETTVKALESYAQLRNQEIRHPKCPAFFLSRAGTRLFTQNVWATFSRVRRWAQLPTKPRSPCLHDFRHGFAIKTLIRWYKEGADVEQKIAALSTYLGHIDPSNTYWYLTAVPELMQSAVGKFEASLRRSK